MAKKTIYLATATIHGLNSKTWFFEEKSFWAWSINFENCPLIVHNLPFIYAGKTEAASKQTISALKAKFTRKNIYDGDKVAIILDDNGIIAIGKNGIDSWLDVRDKFNSKTFAKLALDFDSLVVEY